MATRTAWHQARAWFHLTDDDVQTELVAHAQGRALLCTVTGLHDRHPDGHCRDCLTLLGPEADCCDDTRTIDLPRTPWGGIR